jgi:hypothetical protein
MPECAAEYLVGYLIEIGPTIGERPITHTDIQAWQILSGITLTPFESATLKRMSESYLSSHYEAKARDCPAPYLTREMIAKNRDAVGKQVANALGGRKR